MSVADIERTEPGDDERAIPVLIGVAGPRLVTEAPRSAVQSGCVGWRRSAKRGLAIVLALGLLVILLPGMTALAAATKLSSRGPVLFRHRRVGQGGATFDMLKFRTMYPDANERLSADRELLERYVMNDFKLPVGDDPRVTRLGRLLRRTSLDELPQLINVLRGEMSLVGPRPVVEHELRHHYGPLAPAYLHVRPGITGRWQTEGRNTIRYPERALLDVEYVEGYRLRHDVGILCRTIPRVLSRDGVH